MKKQLPAFLSGILVTVLLLSLSLTALAGAGKLTLEVDPVHIQVDGQIFQPKDEKGNDVPVFAYNGTTYAPVRALAEAYGLFVGYDKDTNTAVVSDRPVLPKAFVPAADAVRKNTVNVSTAAEFVAAIAPDTEIVLTPGEYDLTPLAHKTSNPYVVWTDKFEGAQLNIQNVNGLTIRGASAAKTSIVTGTSYPTVLEFYGCTDIILSAFTSGHKAAGVCAGAVLGFDNSAGVRISDCSLYGCGCYGVYAWESSQMLVENTEIYDCSSGAAAVFDSSDIAFNGCTLRDNVKSYSVLTVWGSENVTFTSCLIQENHVPADYAYGSALISLEDSTGVDFTRCTIRNNTFDAFFSIYSTGEGTLATNCTFEGNTFTVGPPLG